MNDLNELRDQVRDQWLKNTNINPAKNHLSAYVAMYGFEAGWDAAIKYVVKNQDTKETSDE